MTYSVVVGNGPSYSSDHPYIGTDRDIAIAVATAYISQGKKVWVKEEDHEAQNHMQFNTAEDAMAEYERDIDILHSHRNEYRHFAKWLYTKVNEKLTGGD